MQGYNNVYNLYKKVMSQHSKHNNRSITILDQASGPLGIVQEVNSYHFITICKYSFPHHLCIRQKLNPLLWPIAVSYLELQDEIGFFYVTSTNPLQVVRRFFVLCAYSNG